MNKWWWWSAVGAFAFVFVYEWLVHGWLLMGMYTETAHLWRPEGEGPMWLMFVGQFLFAAVFAYIYTLNWEGKGWWEGVRYGLWIGLLLGALEVGKYTYMPIPVVLAWAWVITAVIKGVGAGVAVSLIYKK